MSHTVYEHDYAYSGYAYSASYDTYVNFLHLNSLGLMRSTILRHEVLNLLMGDGHVRSGKFDPGNPVLNQQRWGNDKSEGVIPPNIFQEVQPLIVQALKIIDEYKNTTLKE